MKSELLIKTVQSKINDTIVFAEELKKLSLNELTWKSNPNSWCILECLEHLNLYSEHYLPRIEEKINQSKYPNEENFISGFWGSYFTKSMLPKGKLNKMNTFKDKNPLHAKLDTSVIDSFIRHQEKTIELLEKSKKVSLNKVKVDLSITRLIKLKIGDLFQFLTDHVIRHLQQIDRVKKEIGL